MITKKGKIWGFSCILIFIFFSSFLTQSAFGADEQAQGTLEFILGNYNITEPRFKAAYQSGGVIKGLAFTASIIKNLDFYFEIRYFHKIGELTYTKEKTEFFLVPTSLGLRFIKKFGLIRPFLGAGIDFYFYYETNPIGTVLDYTKGFHFQGGGYLQITEKLPFWLGLKLKYTRANTEESGHKLELGGLEYSAVFVIAF